MHGSLYDSRSSLLYMSTCSSLLLKLDWSRLTCLWLAGVLSGWDTLSGPALSTSCSVKADAFMGELSIWDFRLDFINILGCLFCFEFP